MNLVPLIVLLILAGVALAFIPMEPRVKTIVVVLIAVVAFSWVLVALFGGTHVPAVRVG